VCGECAIVDTDEPLEEVVDGKTYQATGIRHNRCTHCGEVFLLLGQGDDIRRQVYALARVDLGRLSGSDIRSIRQSLGLTQSQLERRLGISAGLVGRWERDTALQSEMADRYVRDLMAHPELVDAHGLVAREGRGPYKTRGT
jgi:putative zinc finger/helix-turn-helix YgiT family protein